MVDEERTSNILSSTTSPNKRGTHPHESALGLTFLSPFTQPHYAKELSLGIKLIALLTLEFRLGTHRITTVGTDRRKAFVILCVSILVCFLLLESVLQPQWRGALRGGLTFAREYYKR